MPRKRCFSRWQDRSTVYGNRLYRYASMFINNLHGHHQIEDGHYFPDAGCA
ncbi:MAG: hypothetical protein R3D29_08090 [Nitratireductor sp.]